MLGLDPSRAGPRSIPFLCVGHFGGGGGRVDRQPRAKQIARETVAFGLAAVPPACATDAPRVLILQGPSLAGAAGVQVVLGLGQK